MKNTRRYFKVVLAALLLLNADGVGADPHYEVLLKETRIVAVLDEGRVMVKVPYECSRECRGGTFLAQLVKPSGQQVARRVVTVGASMEKRGVLRFTLPVKGERAQTGLLILRYTFRHKGKGKPKRGAIALARIVDGPRYIVRGQETILAGNRALVRVTVQSTRSGKPLSGVEVEATLGGVNFPVQVQRGKTGPGGSFDPAFEVPMAALNQKARLSIRALTSFGVWQETKEILVKQRVKVLLTTDKSIYQPGQTIHVRTLALRSPTGGAVAKARVTFKIHDGRGNLVFRRTTKTGRFGIAHARLQLADQINQGRYRITALVKPPGDKAQQTTKVVRVFKYRLPKFWIRTKLGRAYYRPGELLTGLVKVGYVFNKPVVGGQVELWAARRDVQKTYFAHVKGKTDRAGVFKFSVKLPRHFVGQALNAGRALALLTIHVREPGGQQRAARATVPVVRYPIRIALVPESGNLAGGIRQKVHLMTALPDGTATPAKVRIQIQDRGHAKNLAVQTDARGIGHFWYRPEPKQSSIRRSDQGRTIYIIPFDADDSFQARLSAHDSRGRRGYTNVKLSVNEGKNQVLVRPLRSLLRVGDRLELEVLTSRSRSQYAYVDLVRAGQTVSTHEVRLRGGKGKLSVVLTPRSSGVLQLSAYVFDERGEAVRDTRPVMVHEARDLKVKVRTDRDTYEPGQPARLRFSVTDGQGQPVVAALGVQIVDSAVYALGEMEPGLARAFFRLERDLLQPRVAVVGLSSRVLSEPGGPAARRRQARAAEVLLSAASRAHHYSLKADSQTRVLKQLGERAARQARPAITSIARRIAAAMKRYYRRHQCDEYPPELDDLVEKRWIGSSRLLDPWGERVSMSADYDEETRKVSLSVTSGGLDEYEGNADDVEVELLFRIRNCRRSRQGGVGIGDLGARTMGSATRVRRRSRRASSGHRVRAVSGPGLKTVRFRRRFPEALYINPALITDARGEATVRLEMADSITTWRTTVLASTVNGRLGSTSKSIRVFKEFFTDVTLPPELTRGDRVTVPVAVHSYLRSTQRVQISLSPAPWFQPVGGGHSRTITLGPNSVGAVRFSIKVLKAGTWPLKVAARGQQASDGVERLVTVRPDGDRTDFGYAGLLEGPADHRIHIPGKAIPGSSSLRVQVVPGPLAAAVDGLESMLRVPHGCFEQTSSTTYPNVMILRYLKNTKRASPALAMRARRLISTGLQRLLSFEVKGGGFSLYGQAPADKTLTAYGLHQFVDMASVHPGVDQRLIRRTSRFLVSLQRPDGSWSPGPSYFFRRAPTSTDRVRVTAYVAWALLRAGERGGSVHRAIRYVQSLLPLINDAYTTALVALCLMEEDPKHAGLVPLFARLGRLQLRDKRGSYWTAARGDTITGSSGEAANVETTALATQALLRFGRHHLMARKALGYLATAKPPGGGWGSTQATVLALQALMLVRSQDRKDVRGTVTVTLDGRQVGRLDLDAADRGVLQVLDLSRHVGPGRSRKLGVHYQGEGTPMYQVTGSYHLPYSRVPSGAKARSRLGLKVTYNRRYLSTRDTVTAGIELRNRTNLAAAVPMIEVGRPAGFDPLIEDLERLVQKGQVSRFEVLNRRIVFYLNQLPAGASLRFSYRLKARYPVQVTVPPSRAYEYYDAQKKTCTHASAITAY